MTVKQLKEKIKDLPDNMDVFVDERYTEFKYGLVNNVDVMEIDFMEQPGDETLSSYDVLVISED